MPPTLRQWLAEAPFALGMSSGFFGFFAHCGMLSALEQRGLLPSRVSGSSAGALVAGAWAAGLSAEAQARTLLRLRRQDFWDPGPGAGLLRGRRFREGLREMLPGATFDDCRVPLSVSVFDLLSLGTRVISSGDLARAICASCAVPLLFQPVWIDYRPLLDGGIADRPGLAGMPKAGRLLFHHLTARSPWRRLPVLRKDGLAPAARPGMITLAIEGLARVHPFALWRGRLAHDQARRATLRALDRPLEGPVVSVRAR